MLADLGAEVVVVEPPGGHAGRFEPPFAGGVEAPDRSLPFLYRNAGKRSLAIDLARRAGRKRLDALLAAADVLVENLAPADRDRLALGPADVRTRHRRLVHVAIADYGLSGPRASWRLEPLPAFAASGALYGSGFPDRPPCWIPGHLAHDCASGIGVAGALVALAERDRTGDGDLVEVSVQEAAIASLAPWALPVGDYARAYPFLTSSPPRDADGPYLVLPTRDGFVRALPGTPRQLAAFLRLLWRPPAAGAAAPARSARAGSAATSPLARLMGGATAPDSLLAPLGRLATEVPLLLARSLPDGALSGIAERFAGAQRRTVGLASAAIVTASRLAPMPGLTLVATRAALAIARRAAAAALAVRERREVLDTALRLRVPVVLLQTPDEFATSEQARVRRSFVTTRLPQVGRAPFARSPFRFSRTPASSPDPAPPPPDRAGGGTRAFRAWSARVADGTTAAATRAKRSARAAGTGRPLVGLRVVELGFGAAVPEIGWLLAELGAEVIKIESEANLDFLRRATPEPDEPNRSWMFNDANRGKRSVAIDLRTPRGRELGRALCARADVVLENARGGAAEALGLGYEDVRRLRRDVVYLSSQGYGRGGPLGEAPSFGPLVSAFAGITWLQNHPDAPYPAGSSLNHPDHAASKLGLVAVLAALDHRRRTGEGQHVELAQTDVAAFLAGPVYLETPCTGRAPRQRGNASDAACPHGVYPSEGDDRWCAIAVASNDDWQRFRRCLGWRDEPRLATLAGRLAARDEVDGRVARWTRERTPEEASRALQRAGVSAAPVASADDLRSDRHLAARGALVTLADPGVSAVRHCANPIRFRGQPGPPAGPAPELGADTVDVLTGILGLTPEAARRLVADGVCR